MHDSPAPISSLPRRLWRGRYVVIYVALAASFVAQVRHFHDSRTGFSSMIEFGDVFQPRRLARLYDVPIHTLEKSVGYDGQFYAQIAVAGNPLDPELRTALDSAPYRARRILLPVLAHLAGLGRPAWVLQAYALSNVFCWLLLALLLARWWFPPTDVHNLLRWAGTLCGEGMLASVRYSLTDGPALLFIALGVRLVERNRRLVGAALLGAAGLVRETSVLCAAAFLPATKEERRGWRRAALAAAICALPIVLWAGVLTARYGWSGSRIFDLPLVSYVKKLCEIHDGWRAQGFGDPIRDIVWAVIALGTQVGFVLARPKPDEIWWRIGLTFSILWLCLGWAVWEGTPSAASRTVLPLTLAFNVLAPRSPSGLALLVAGNLTVLSATTVLAPPPMSSEQSVFAGGVSCSYAEGWHGPESLEGRAWRWASGPATLRFHNPTTETQFITLDFQIVSVTDRTVTVHAPDLERSFRLRGAPTRLPASFGPFRLPPGDTPIVLTTAEPPWLEKVPSGRSLTFSLENLHARAPGQ